MTAFIAWWVLALLVGLAELFVGSLHLLVIALGFAAAGGVAYFGADLTWQVVCATAVSVAGWALLWWRQRTRDRGALAGANPDMLLDIGARVQVEQWTTPRATDARYRGANWAVELSASVTEPGRPGAHVIERIEGSRLVVRPAD